jgi:hypothetical protein
VEADSILEGAENPRISEKRERGKGILLVSHQLLTGSLEVSLEMQDFSPLNSSVSLQVLRIQHATEENLWTIY